MVVIRAPVDDLENRFGREIVDLIFRYGSVIGYSVDRDKEIKIEFNPDRPDLFSFPTLVKQVKIFFYGDVEIRKPQSVDESIRVSVSRGVRGIRPYLSTFTAEGSSIGDYFDDLIGYQEVLHASIGKDRSKMAIGIHDLEKTGNRIYYTTVRRNKGMQTYDGMEGTVEYIVKNHEKGFIYGKLLPSDERYVAITDAEGNILSLPPIVNSHRSRIDRETKKFFIDITGTDINSVKFAHHLLSNFFSSLKYRIRVPIIEGIPSSEIESIRSFDFRLIRPRRRNVERFLGQKMEDQDIIVHLRRMGYVAEPGSPEIAVYVPGYRVDVMGEMDIIEDILKSIGIENVSEKRISIGRFGKPFYMNEVKNLVRDVMIGLGFQEVMTFVLSPAYYMEGYTGGTRVQNPKSEDYSVLRDKIYPDLLDLLAKNKKNGLPQRIFEIGEKMVEGRQRTALSCVIADTKSEFSTAKSYMQAFLMRFTKENVNIVPEGVYGAIDGRSGSIRIGENKIGVIGEIHPAVLERFSLVVPVSFFEIDLDMLQHVEKDQTRL
ncbi:phenylalanine--tRNA ligase subunit beta [Thermoplasma sp.]|uniref:phenylalanine--tRNA ligase subunit beta n=1 Tax=Thermoplasma sp. TaxID=1973142 RepID=UPI00127B004C|nr:phenylalanine--tRNA ligase subunit beta [Thermoplasma sp.]KAA8923447.1 MAG: phenylalanine--tRNA ligase subunit beta [Thermoplasma sp.]